MKFVYFTVLVGLLNLQILINVSNAAPNKTEQDDCTVNTTLGMVRGKTEISRNGKRYCSYLGIPYTNTPKRFEEAKMVEPWAGIKNATNYGAHCPQFETAFSTDKYLGEEDCLFLNVYYPLDDQCQNSEASTTAEALPVLVNFHTGALEVGIASDCLPTYIMDECTVFLAMNYRLGALGFLTTNDGLIPGNLGLKDQILALKWTQENIKYFHGNPNSVTLIGISAGSTSIANLIASPAGKGLFHRAILESGTALPSIYIKKNPTRTARAVSKRLNCTVDDTTSTAGLKDCLLAASAKDIVHNQRLYDWNMDPFLTFGPTVENLNASNPIHTVNPFYKLVSGDFNRIPIIIGFTENEGLLLQAIGIISNPKALADLNTKWEEIAPIHLYYNEDSIPQMNKNYFSKEIRNFYFGNKSVGMETFQDLINLHSDRYFVQSIMDTVELHSRYAPVYPYVFTYKDGFSLLGALGYPAKVATHGSDAQFLFKFQYNVFPEITKDSPTADFSEKLIKLWVTFAQTGNPSETWPVKNLMKPYKDDGASPKIWYQIDKEITELPINYLQDRREFWRNLGLRNYEYPVYY